MNDAIPSPTPALQGLQRGRRALLSIGLMSLVPGCVGGLPWHRNEYGPPPPARASKTDLIQHLNANISKIYAWRSTSVTIKARTGLPMQVSGVIAVESPRNFRLRVSSVMGDEADFGSNPERFWFWMRRNEPKHVYTSTHDDMHKAMQKLPLPFQPDWLMDVLGVIPLDPSQFEVETTDARTLTVSLVSEQLSPSGQPVKRLVVVDAQHGVILGHYLYDVRGTLIARAVMKNYRFHPQAQVNFPHCIDLDWPQAGMAMTLTIGRDVEINPSSLPQPTFELPQIPGSPMMDLGR